MQVKVAFGRRRSMNRITGEEANYNNNEEPPLNISGKFSKEINRKLTVLANKGCDCLLYENLREVNVSFETRRGVSVIFINLSGGECNFPII